MGLRTSRQTPTLVLTEGSLRWGVTGGAGCAGRRCETVRRASSVTAAGPGCTPTAGASPTSPTGRWSGRRRRANTVPGCVQVPPAVTSLLVTGWSRQSVTEFLFRLQPHGSVATKNSAWTSQLHRHQWNFQPGRDSSGRQTDEESEQEEPPRGDSSALLGHKGEMTPQCQMFM